MNQNTFQQKLETLASFPDVKSETVKAVGNVLEGLPSWELFRINPVRFAEEHKFEPSEIVNLFVHGAKIGLFDFAWNLLCPPCGSIVDSHLSLNDIESNLTGVILVLTDLPRMHGILEDHPSAFRPFLTGKMLLNNQSFRELFRIQTLIPDLKLRLRSLTLLFTDLKGSTALYDQTGDVVAYNLVQEHYKILTESVRENAGAVIKTMGDAIMATFSSPLDGVKAAIQMMDRMGPFNSRLRQENRALGLKIGLHEGSALAVNAEDRLDYFGQTVNVAARVQGLAQADEICVTEQVFQADGVRRAFADKGYQEQSRLVSLKGVGQPANVYQLRKQQ